MKTTAAHSTPEKSMDQAVENASHDAHVWIEQTIESVETYAREKPWQFGAWMLGIGFVLGWKMKI
jgi:ElaB/YqjD/DUF883 family membrane-anchored ribosome-binding protein